MLSNTFFSVKRHLYSRIYFYTDFINTLQYFQVLAYQVKTCAPSLYFLSEIGTEQFEDRKRVNNNIELLQVEI